MTLLHQLYCDYKDNACGSGHCYADDKYYSYRCIPALCFVRWLVKNGKATLADKEIEEELLKNEDEKY